jgi:hypothetical protein
VESSVGFIILDSQERNTSHIWHVHEKQNCRVQNNPPSAFESIFSLQKNAFPAYAK